MSGATKMWFLVFLCAFVNVRCFNLDTVNYVLQQGTDDSMFGFSVSAHSTRGTAWTIIGAPKAQTRQIGVHEGGSVFRCLTDRDRACQEVEFDPVGNRNNSAGQQIDSKTKQWFGATVNSGGPDKPIVACAPRYVYFSMTKGERRDPVGTCYVSSGDFSRFHEYSPCRTKNWGYHRQGACQAGLGAAVAKDGESLFIGAPGSWYWQGQLYSLDPSKQHPFNTLFDEYGQGQAYGQSLVNRPSVLFTKEGSALEDNSYMGYSVTVGEFTGDHTSGVAVGMPRGHTEKGKLVGKVVLYTWNLTNHQNISGEQLGAYFGYALATADIDGDDYDDLIIGAPLYTEPNNEGKYEVGRIYVRYQRSQGFKGRFEKYDFRDGVNSKGRFGLSVASLGDLDLDGYDDIAVGAPYDGKNERGAVYIYYGSSQGLREKPSQIIRSEAVSERPLYTFGFSVAGNNIDFDGNNFPDMVVGAYASDTAIVFKARQVIKVHASVVFNTTNKVISLEDKTCTLRSGEKVPCTEIHSCFHYNGTDVMRAVDLNVQYILDVQKQREPRMFFLNNERISSMNKSIHLEHRRLNCNTVRVYLKKEIRDKLSPLEVEMRYSLRDDYRDYYSRRSTTTVLPAMLNQNVPEVYKDKITIMKNCGSDDICIPDLRLISRPNVDKYLLGSNKRLEIDVMVQNEGEDSFESVFHMKMPRGVNYFNIERLDGSSNIPVQCSAPSSSTNKTLKCDIGNPLPAEKMVHFKVLLEPYHEEGMSPSYDFLMFVNSTNPENNGTTSDNKQHLSVNIWVETNLSLTGWPAPPELHYNSSLYEVENYTMESEIGPQIVHYYNLKNNGPSLINEATALFIWSEKTIGGDDLLYLLEQPETYGPIKCEFAHANPLKVILEKKKSYLEAIGLNMEAGQSAAQTGVSYGSKSHIDYGHHKTTLNEKNFEDGDGSYVHINRSKNVQEAERGHSSSSSGGKTITHTYSWNSSQIGGGPVVTHTWNKTSVSGSDGINRETVYTNENRGKPKVYYTSSRGAGQESGGLETNNQFSISAQDTSGQFSQGQHEYSQHGSRQSSQYGSSQSSQHGSGQSSQYGSSQNSQHGSGTQYSGSHGSTIQEAHHSSGGRQHFNWNGGSASREVSETQRQHSRGHESDRRTSTTGEGYVESGVYSQSGRETSGSSDSSLAHGQSGYTSGHGGTYSQGSQSSYHANNDLEGSTGRESRFGASGHSGVQRGSHQNATHKITWSVERQHSQSQDGATGGRIPNGFVTEESINEGIDEYTHDVLSHGNKGYSQGSHSSHQENHQSSLHGTSEASYGQQRGHSGQYENSQHRGSSSRHETSGQSGRSHSSYGHHNKTDIDPSLGLGNAAIGGGFRTTTLDLGVSNTHAEEDVSGHGKDLETNYESNYEYTSNEGQYDPDLGSYEDRNYGAAHGGVSYGTSRTYSGRGSGERRGQGSQERHYSRTYESGSNSNRNYDQGSRNAQNYESQGGHQTYSHTYHSGGEVHHESKQFGDNVPNYSGRQYHRQKREVGDDGLGIKCNATQCRTLKCTAGPLQKDQEVYVVLRFRLNALTIKKMRKGSAIKDSPVDLSSMMRARIDRLPYIGTPKDEERLIHSHEVFTSVQPTADAETKVTVEPIWVWVVAACAGVILLLIIAFLLYKCGFFKRNRPSDAPERQPLNRNGHYNGDEQL